MPVSRCWRNCARASCWRWREAGASTSPTIAERWRRCWRGICPIISTSCSYHPNIRAKTSGGGCSPSPDSICRTKSRCAACAKTKKRGAGTNAKVLRSKRNRLSRRPDLLLNIIDGRRKEPLDDETLLVATLAVVFRAVADGRNRKTLRARADRHFHRRAEDAGISCDQSDGQGAGADGGRCHARGSRRDLRLCRRTLSGSETRPAAGRSAAREISLLAVFRARLHRTGDGAGRDQDRDEPGGGGLGRCPAGIRRARHGAGEGTVDPRRTILGRGYHHRLRAELRGAAVQDGTVAPVIRPLHRSLRGRPSSARACLRRGSGDYAAPFPFFKSSGRGIEMML